MILSINNIADMFLLDSGETRMFAQNTKKMYWILISILKTLTLELQFKQLRYNKNQPHTNLWKRHFQQDFALAFF